LRPVRASSQPRQRHYAFRLAIECISGQPLDEGFETWSVARGHELEPVARMAHEMATGLVIEDAVFALSTTHCSAPAPTASPRGSRTSSGNRIHQNIGSLVSLMGINLRHETAEMLTRAMKVQSRTIRPRLDENKVTRILLIREQVIADAQWFLTRQFHKFLIERSHDLDCLDSNEILRDYFKHSFSFGYYIAAQAAHCS